VDQIVKCGDARQRIAREIVSFVYVESQHERDACLARSSNQRCRIIGENPPVDDRIEVGAGVSVDGLTEQGAGVLDLRSCPPDASVRCGQGSFGAASVGIMEELPAIERRLPPRMNRGRRPEVRRSSVDELWAVSGRA
jgi:hypothetical protein